MSALPPLRSVRQRVLQREWAELCLGATLIVAAVAALGLRPLAVAAVWLAVVTPRLVAIDAAEHRLPDRILLPGYPVVLTAVLADALVAGRDLAGPLVAGAVYGLVLLVLHVAGGMGFGDVKLAPLLGLLLGALSPAAAVAGPMLAFLVGGALAVGVLARSGRGARLPFGPPMLLGAWAAALLAH